MKHFIHPDGLLDAVETLYLIIGKTLKILIFSVIHLFLLVILLFALWFFEIYPEDVSRFLNTLFQSSFGLLLAVFGVSIPTLVLLYMKAWKYISKKISSVFVWMPALTFFDTPNKTHTVDK